MRILNLPPWMANVHVDPLTVLFTSEYGENSFQSCHILILIFTLVVELIRRRLGSRLLGWGWCIFESKNASWKCLLVSPTDYCGILGNNAPPPTPVIVAMILDLFLVVAGSPRLKSCGQLQHRVKHCWPPIGRNWSDMDGNASNTAPQMAVWDYIMLAMPMCQNGSTLAWSCGSVVAEYGNVGFVQFTVK